MAAFLSGPKKGSFQGLLGVPVRTHLGSLIKAFFFLRIFVLRIPFKGTFRVSCGAPSKVLLLVFFRRFFWVSFKGPFRVPLGVRSFKGLGFGVLSEFRVSGGPMREALWGLGCVGPGTFEVLVLRAGVMA